jgi:hypothetical protein
MAHEVGASDDPKDFDKAFKRVTDHGSRSRRSRDGGKSPKESST